MHGFLVLSSDVPNATQGSVISKTVWVAKTMAAIAAPNIAGAVETVKTVKTVWKQCGAVTEQHSGKAATCP